MLLGLWLLGVSAGVAAQPKPELSDEELAWIAEHPVIRVANELDWPPFDFVEEGAPRGLAIDLVELLAGKVGLQVEFVNGYSWQELMALFQRGDLDLMPALWRTQEREGFMRFTRSYIDLSFVLITRSNSPYRSLEAIETGAGKLAMVISYASSEGIISSYPGIEPVWFESPLEAMKAVSNGLVDGYVDNQPIASYLIHQHLMTNLHIAAPARLEGLVEKPIHMAVQPGQPHLHSLINKALSAVTREEFSRLMMKWSLRQPETSSRLESLDLTLAQERYLQEQKEVSYCVDPNWMPFERISDSGKHEGMVADLLAKIEARLGLKLRLLPTNSWSESLEAVREGRCRILAAASSVSESRRKDLDFTQPFGEYPLVVAVRQEELFVDDLAAISQERLAVVRSYAHIGLLRQRYPNLKIVEVEDVVEGLEQVRTGKVFGFVDPVPSIGYNLRRLAMDDLKIGGKLDIPLRLGIGVRKGEPAELLAALDKALASFSEEELQLLEDKWFSIRVEKVFDMRPVWQVLAAASLVVLIFLYWNRKLARLNGALARKERDLIEQQRDFRVILESAPAMIWYLGRDHRVTRVNEKAARLSSLTPQEAIGKSFYELFPEDLAHQYQQANEEIFIAGRPRLGIIEPGPDDQGRPGGWMRTDKIPTLDEEGNVTGLAIFVADITRERRAEEALRQSEEDYRTIFDSANDALMIHSLEDGGIENVNQRMLDLFECASKEEILGSFVGAISAGTPPYTEAEAFQWVNKAAQGEPQLFEWYAKTARGRLFWAEVSLKRVVIGGVGKVLAVVRDITERRDVAAALNQAKEAAEAASRAKSEFLANMSHEIRTPLNPIIGLTHLALQSDPEPQVRGYLEKIQTASRSLLQLINDILDFSKIEAGKLEMEEASFSLAKVLDNLRNLHAPHAQEKQLEFRVELPPDMPTHVVGDPLRLEQVLNNLVSNAIKFTAAGRVLVELAAREVSDASMLVEFSVEDTGVGMSTEQSHEMFQAFTQADGSTTRKFGGTGLGLAISQRLTAMMGGVIKVESAPDQGSRFSFRLRLPLVHPDQVQEGAGDEPSLVVPDFEKGHVLLVEDNVVNQEVARYLLEESGLKVTLAENGEEAVAAVIRDPFDLVLMDIQMPVMDGYLATRAIRGETGLRDLPIIAMTAHAMAADRERCLAAGMNGHIAKPIDPPQLYATLTKWLVQHPANNR
jgi:polar amino acid transport system substrate-binding protein